MKTTQELIKKAELKGRCDKAEEFSLILKCLISDWSISSFHHPEYIKMPSFVFRELTTEIEKLTKEIADIKGVLNG